MRRQTTRAALVSFVSIVAALSVARDAAAGSGYEFPENGTEQLGRGGAWVARATNPLATYFNPAGLAGQRSGVMLNTSLIWQKTCLKRTLPNGEVATSAGGTFRYPEEVCNTDSGKPFLNPQLAGVLRISDRLGIGLAVMGPSTRGRFSYPEAVEGTYLTLNKTGEYASPQRYLLVKDDLFFVWPQIAIGYEVAPNLRFGASLIWGIARLQFTAYASGMATSRPDAGIPVDEFDQDVSAALDVKDMFVPGFTVGSLYSPSRNFDLGAWFQWMDDIKAKGNAEIVGPMYDANGKLSEPSSRTTTKTTGDKASMTAPWPMQARIGGRYHKPRRKVPSHQRDPMADDVFDVELDITWANNSRFDQLDVHFAPGVFAYIRDVNNPQSQISLEMPQNASIPHHWKDAFGFRLGGDYMIIENRLAARAGAFFQTEAQDPKYLHIDYVASQMYGLDVGATLRLGSLDLMAAYGHVFFKGLDNGGNGATQGLAGSPPFRTQQAVNGGSVSSAVNVASLGAGYTF